MFNKLFRKSTIDRALLDAYIEANYTPNDDIVASTSSDNSVIPSLKAAFFAPKMSARAAEAMPMCEPDEACEEVELFEKCALDEDIYCKIDDEAIMDRLSHMSDTFSEYLMYLIENKGMNNAEVYKRSLVDKKTFSKIKNNINYHPQKITVLCLCIGLMLNLDEAKDLLERAGYALSPCNITDVIFSYFIENQIYDMIELDIQLEEHGAKCLIS